MRKQKQREVRFLIEAIQSCAVHPKYQDPVTLAEASVDEDYLHFADQLHWFAFEIEEMFAARGTLSPDFVEEKWQEHMTSIRWKEGPYRIALIYFRKLLEELRGPNG